MKHEQLTALLLQSLEHEIGGVVMYETAIQCAINESLRIEWEDYLEQTREHAAILRDVCDRMGIDADEETPGRDIVRDLDVALVEAMQNALADGDAEAAQLVACECVTIAETRDHFHWQLIRECADKLRGVHGRTLQEACEEVEAEENEHLYHTRGWCRELWVQALGLKAVLPPPEERRPAKAAVPAPLAMQAGARPR